MADVGSEVALRYRIRVSFGAMGESSRARGMWLVHVCFCSFIAQVFRECVDDGRMSWREPWKQDWFEVPYLGFIWASG